jgi:iron complex outermembrane receptor protein
MGYYLYGEFEDSDSFYDNTEVEQTILQASFDVDLSDKMHMQFGGMYHDYEGNQVAGWNRLTQDLIDNGTYVTGTATAPGYGWRRQDLAPGILCWPSAPCPTLPFRPSSLVRPTSIRRWRWRTPAPPRWMRATCWWTPTTSWITRSSHCTSTSTTTSTTAPKITNHCYYETIDNINENAYGFSQFGEVDRYREQAGVRLRDRDFGGHAVADFPVLPSIRYTDFLRGQDFINEYFDRRDLSQSNAERDPSLDTRLLSTQINDDYSEYQSGDYTMYGLAFLGDFTFDNGLIVTLGVRQDYIEVDSNTP